MFRNTVLLSLCLCSAIFTGCSENENESPMMGGAAEQGGANGMGGSGGTAGEMPMGGDEPAMGGSGGTAVDDGMGGSAGFGNTLHPDDALRQSK